MSLILKEVGILQLLSKKIDFWKKKNFEKFLCQGSKRGPLDCELSHKTTTLKELAWNKGKEQLIIKCRQFLQ